MSEAEPKLTLEQEQIEKDRKEYQSSISEVAEDEDLIASDIISQDALQENQDLDSYKAAKILKEISMILVHGNSGHYNIPRRLEVENVNVEDLKTHKILTATVNGHHVELIQGPNPDILLDYMESSEGIVIDGKKMTKYPSSLGDPILTLDHLWKCIVEADEHKNNIYKFKF